MKSISSITQAPSPHWVGNGFPVRSLFSYNANAEQMSPFLLLDYAAPMDFPADGIKRGVGEHPHRGFETVTIVYKGEVQHRDSTGKGGVIGPGDVQWMTAGSGILHEEFHSTHFSQTGGQLHMVQLWVNLPKADKMTAPGYQGIVSADIPVVSLPENAGTLRPIAGEYANNKGPASTFTSLNVWDMHLDSGADLKFDQPEGWTSAIIVLHGLVSVNGSEPASDASMVLLSREQTGVRLQAQEPSLVLLLSGEPINEPVVGYGPFVMNSKAEIQQAYHDLQNGKFGRI